MSRVQHQAASRHMYDICNGDPLVQTTSVLRGYLLREASPGGLLVMFLPTFSADMQQCVFAIQWAKQGIPNFTSLLVPLHKFIDGVYNYIRTRIKCAVTVV